MLCDFCLFRPNKKKYNQSLEDHRIEMFKPFSALRSIYFISLIIGNKIPWKLKRLTQAAFKRVDFHVLPLNIFSPSVAIFPARTLSPSPNPDICSTHSIQFVFMEDYDVDMDEDEEGEVFMRKATTGPWWEDCVDDGNCDIQHQRGERGCMVNSRSWAEELQDIFAPQSEDSYIGGQTRLSSISVSDCLSLFLPGPHKH